MTLSYASEICTGRNSLARPRHYTARPGPARPVFNLEVAYHLIRIQIKSSRQSAVLAGLLVIPVYLSTYRLIYDVRWTYIATHQTNYSQSKHQRSARVEIFWPGPARPSQANFRPDPASFLHKINGTVRTVRPVQTSVMHYRSF